MSRIGVLRYQLEQANDEIARLRSSSFVTAVPSEEYEKVKTELANLKAERDQLKADLEKSDGVVWTLSVENDRLKQSLRLQIEQNALAQVGFKMYQDNVDSGGLHKDRKDAIARLEAENARLQAEVERLTFVDDFIVITKPSIKKLIENGVQNVPGRYDEQYLIQVNKECYLKVLKHMAEFWDKSKGVQS
jgi:cell division protein FtsB